MRRRVLRIHGVAGRHASVLLLLFVAASSARAQSPAPPDSASPLPTDTSLCPAPAGSAAEARPGAVPVRPAADPSRTRTPTPPAAAGLPSEWGVAADLAFNSASGNTSMTVLSTAVKLTHRRADSHEFEFTIAYDYGVSEGRTIERREQSGLKFDLYPHATWSPFVFTGIEREPARRIDKQAFGGAGLKFVFWNGASGKASISLASLYNYENTLTQSRLLSALDRTARWSLRFKGARSLGGNLKLDNTTFYQPVWNRGGDYNIDVSTSLSVQASKTVSLFIRHGYRRDSTPAELVRPVDQRVSAGLGFKF